VTDLKIIDIDPVRRERLAYRLLLEMAAHRPVLAKTRRAKDEQVKSLPLDFGSKANGLDRPFLTDQPIDLIEFCRGLEVEGFWIAGRAKALWRKRARRGISFI